MTKEPKYDNCVTRMPPLAIPEALDADRKPNWNVVRMFDLTLHYDDEALGHDETGCYLCLLGCRKPLYQAGRVVTGHMVVRSVRNLHISGVSVIFGGRYVTKWNEDGIMWGNCSLFYEEVVHVVAQRKIVLDGKRYYRYDFEYRLPIDLPSSLKWTDGKLVYSARGVVHLQTGSDVYTNTKRFRIRATVDIARLPSSFNDPKEGANGKIYNSWLTGDDHIRARLTLNSQAIVSGQPLIAMATVDNLTSCDVSYCITFQQVLTLKEIIGCENRGKTSKPLYRKRRHSNTTAKVLASSSTVVVRPQTRMTARRIFSVPRSLPPTSQSHTSVAHPLRHPGDVITPHILVGYIVKLTITSESDGSELNIPVEVDIGTTDSRSQQDDKSDDKSVDAVSTIETDCSMYSHSLYSHSSIL